MQLSSKFQTPILGRSASSELYEYYKAALEWDLTEPIVLESSDDFKSTPRWAANLHPYHHQISNLITFCRRLPVTLLADDVGLGKTISAGLIISELLARSRLKGVLIVCPKVLCPQWKEELETKFNLQCKIATGRELLEAMPGSEGAVVTTYDSARTYLDNLPEDRFEMLILDEAHKLRNLYGTVEPPKVAKTFRNALKERRFRFVLMLTATPIQNRLWDLYSLVDLLSVARGHENPFGTPGMFARNFIADESDKARQLKPSAKEGFRAIIYGYMSRVRRGDANLSFPDRVIQMHRTAPTPAELHLIELIAEPIQKMNRLAQISILQALSSSPDALAAQLGNMARNGSAPKSLAENVARVVRTMPTSAKLAGLETLIRQLRAQNPDDWRLVIFTIRKETQTTIQNHLLSLKINVGLINGDSASRNQETIRRFRENPSSCRVVISTEAGSEGVNLQVANALVNYDLPWNPMIVEQRIGRVQRLGSTYAFVSIFNMTLAGTFEEYIVARLLEKLQMASHAIGDIESLLQGASVGSSEDDADKKFEDQILSLVLATLQGKDVEEDVRLKEASIEEAKRELEREEANIDSMLGSMDGLGYVGPRAPTLPEIERSMPFKEFTLGALKVLGADLTPERDDVYLCRENGQEEIFTFAEHATTTSRVTYLTPRTAFFQRLVKRLTSSGMHEVRDADVDTGAMADKTARGWIESFGAKPHKIDIVSVSKRFSGQSLLRVRATTAHDSFERLVNCECAPADHSETSEGKAGIASLTHVISSPKDVGVNLEALRDVAEQDVGIAEFCRFYIERGAIEVEAAGNDLRKAKKLESDFTPRLLMTVVGLKGEVRRDVVVRASYSFGSGHSYSSDLTITPGLGVIVSSPELNTCEQTGQAAPSSCFRRCDISGKNVLKHVLIESEFSARKASEEFVGTCALTGKRALLDELEVSQLTGKRVAASLMKTSALTNIRGEPAFFAKCQITGDEALKSELQLSAISQKLFRNDQAGTSDISGIVGHKSEFTMCIETKRTIAIVESEMCEVSHHRVSVGLLVRCEETGKRVLSSLLGVCAASHKSVLQELLVSSSESQTALLRSKAIKSSDGLFCLPAEAEKCVWTGADTHPRDIRVCSITGLPIRFDVATKGDSPKLKPLLEMLDGVRRTTDAQSEWPDISTRLQQALDGRKLRIEAAVASPSSAFLAICSESKQLLGFKTRHLGALFSLHDRSIAGRIAEGKRHENRWTASV